MSEYIKREDAIKAFKRVLDEDFPYISEETPRERIAAIPSADVVEVVRCKDCKYWKSNTEFCEFWGTPNVAQRTCKNDYCSYGEREDGENE